ncbi:hypothetical protein QW71_11080 [Paenibacillus sp. IHB B 3415]|nr:hypothetical protein QW71_11080 [Paenibacillus sp. IHB B 3415]
MKGERQQDQNQNNEERPFKYNAGDRTIGMEMSQSASVASAAAEFLTDGERRKSSGNMSRTYFRRPGERPAFLVLRGVLRGFSCCIGNYDIRLLWISFSGNWSRSV